MEGFKPGDVVGLKSGGPRMTVQSVKGEEVSVVFYRGRDQDFLQRQFSHYLLNKKA